MTWPPPSSSARRCSTSRPRRWIRSRPPRVVFDQAADRRVLPADPAGLRRSAHDRTCRHPVPSPGAETAVETPLRPRTAVSVPQLDPDAAARVASFGAVPPMRERGIETVRASPGVRAATRDGRRWPTSRTGSSPAPVGRHSAADLSPDRPTGRRPCSCTSTAAEWCWGPTTPSNRWRAPWPTPRVPRSSPWNTVWRRSFRHPRSSTMPTPPRPGSSQHADELGVDPTRLAVVGDSAGGSLAAAVALAARDRGGPPICCQVLLYPGLDRDMARGVDRRDAGRADADP